MPLNILRLNHQPSTHPNDRIAFIRPLPGRPDSDVADTFLHAIAAQCLPIMKRHHLSITTLEEHEPNKEFIGRNFNNGEIIQLVLRSRSGGWVSFNMVQMVMMHELAHNVHMNHGKGFWGQRNAFVGQMKGLWQKNYTGEGLWGNGRTMQSLEMVKGTNVVPSQDLADLQICGGTFRSRRGRKRKRGAVDEVSGGQELTRRQKKDRRIQKKFGKNGQSLGGDEDTRMMLEIGRKGPTGGKPRVAGSKRGRELRAAAALARFDVQKAKEEESPGSESGEDDENLKGEDAIDENGQRLLDSMGFGMVRVCGDEDQHEAETKREMEELEVLDLSPRPSTFKTQKLLANIHQEVRQGSASAHNHRRQTPPLPLTSATSSSIGGNIPIKKEYNPIYDIPEYRGSPTPPASPLSPGPAANGNGHPRKTAKVVTSQATPISKQTEMSNQQSLTTTSTTAVSKQPYRNHSDQEAQQAWAPNAVQPHVSSNELTISQTKEAIAARQVQCLICSFFNLASNPTCTACSHVLDVRKDPNHWRCLSEVCKNTQFINAGDCGVCCICGARK